VLRKLYDWTLEKAASPAAELWLAVIAFIESSVFLIPADVLFVPMALAVPKRAYRYALIATLASTAGGVAGYYLGHFAYSEIAKPVLELYGKLEGCSHGYGGSMHLYDVERGNMGANAVVGGGLPGIVGAALAFKFRAEPRVAVAFFGDGATNTGAFHESMNLAQLWTLPAVFVLENNGWAESTPAQQQLPLPVEEMEKRALAYGMTSMEVDGQDVEAVYGAMRGAREHAVSGQGPVFMNVRTYRFTGHYVGDPQVYREKGEVHQLRETQDPLELLRVRLGMTSEEFERLDAEVSAEVDASVEFAKNGTDPKPEDALKNVYA